MARCHPEPFACHSEKAKRPKNLAQGKPTHQCIGVWVNSLPTCLPCLPAYLPTGRQAGQAGRQAGVATAHAGAGFIRSDAHPPYARLRLRASERPTGPPCGRSTPYPRRASGRKSWRHNCLIYQYKCLIRVCCTNGIKRQKCHAEH